MSLFGLSPLVFVLGAVGIVAGLVLLHLLRVRLRRVEVDTLLFFRLAGAMQKPRVLPGKPARWLAFLLALLAALLAWTAVAEPRVRLDARSRFVVVEPDPTDHEARLQQAERLGAQLGPRGAVFAAVLPPAPLLAADEPVAALAARGAALRGAASPTGEQAALRAAAALLRPGDELVWVGERAPNVAGVAATHVRVERAPALALRSLHWERAEGGALTLVVGAAGAALAGELRAGGQVLVRAEGVGEVRFADCAVPAGQTQVELTLTGLLQPLAVPVPQREPLRVFVAPEVPADLARAVAAVLAVDGELQPATDAATAEVLVAAADDANDPRPRLVLSPGVGDGARTALLLPGSPAACSLRDRHRRSASTLPPLAQANVWIADAAQGGALAAATANGGPRVWIVDWLLRPLSHADVPLLLTLSLRELGARPGTLLSVAGQAAAVPAAFATACRSAVGAVLPVDGITPLAFTTAGAQTLTSAAGARTVHVLQPQPAARAVGATGPAAELASVGGDGSLTLWLLLLLLSLLVVDAILFHRGRLP